MLPQPKRAEFLEAFGEKKVKALEDMLNLLAKAADDSGLEKKERPLTFADLDRQLKAMEAAGGVRSLTEQYHLLLNNLADEYIVLVIDTVSQKEKAMITKITKDFDIVAHIIKSLPDSLKPQTKQKAAPAPSGPSPFAPRTLAGVAPIFGGSSNANKEAEPDGTPLGNIFAVNQSYGKKPAKAGTFILDGVYDINQAEENKQ